MRRLAAPSAVAAAAAALAPRRGIYSIWHTTPFEPETHAGVPAALLSKENYRYTSFCNTPLLAADAAPAVASMAGPQRYLYSAIADDLARLGGLDWTFEFDSFWADRVASHESMFAVLYGRRGGLLNLVMGDYSADAAGRAATEAKLRELKSMLKWAQEAERVYSQIAAARFTMQREVFESLEREKVLAGCVELVNDFRARVPTDYKRKACQELDWHLLNVRHWVWDCPNAKREFPRTLA